MKTIAQEVEGFTLVEIAIALWVISFALLGVMALHPVGIQMNRRSMDESQAAGILTTVEADLRNSYPGASFHMPLGYSQIYGLLLPYGLSSSGRVVLNRDVPLASTSLPADSSIGLDAYLAPKDISSSPPLPFQATVVYTRVPGAGLEPIEARIIVSWPALKNATVSDLTDPAKVKGYVQAYVIFTAP